MRGFNDKVFSDGQNRKERSHQFKVAFKRANRDVYWLLEKTEPGRTRLWKGALPMRRRFGTKSGAAGSLGFGARGVRPLRSALTGWRRFLPGWGPAKREGRTD